MVTKKTVNIEELLNNTVSYWICPVTGTKIESSKTDLIDAHKQKIIKEQKDKEKNELIKKENKKIINALKKSTYSLSYITEFDEILNIYNEKINPLFNKNEKSQLHVLNNKEIKDLISSPDFLKLKDPLIKNIIYYTKHNTISSNFIFIETNLDIPKTKSKLLNSDLFGYGASNILSFNNKNYFILSPIGNNLFKDISKYQSSKKMILSDKDIIKINNDPKYLSLKKSLTDVSNKLHDLKEEYNSIHEQLVDLKNKTIDRLDFFTFQTSKTNDSKKGIKLK